MANVMIARARLKIEMLWCGVLKYLLLLAPIKSHQLVGKTYFQGFYLFSGIFSLIYQPKWIKELVPCFLMAVYACLLGIYFYFENGTLASLLRAIQFLLILYSVQGALRWFNDAKDMKHTFNFWIISSIALYALEVFFGGKIGGRNFYFIERYYLLVGEPNFSAFFYATLAAISLMAKKYRWLGVWVIFASLTFSRTPLVFYALSILFLGAHNVLKDKAKWIGLIIVIITLLHPILFYCLYKIVSPEEMKFLSAMTTRFYLQPLYFEMFLDHPFGVGLGQAYSLFESYRIGAEPYLLDTVGVLTIDSNEQHSLYVQVLTELGVIGSLLLSFFLLRIYNQLCIKSVRVALIFASFLPMMMFLNAINEFGLYLMIYFLLRNFLLRDSGELDHQKSA